jgi:hypothetical protein
VTDAWTLAEQMSSNDGKWFYVGDRNILEGGTAVRVNRMFGYADVVEMTDMGSAAGCDGAVLMTTGSVVLDRAKLTDRRRFRSALQTCGLTMAELGKMDRDTRSAELARAVWVYGFRDEESRVLVHDREAFDAACESGRFEGWQEQAEDCDDVEEAFQEALS